MNLRLAVLGFGNVGQEFARLLIRKRDWLTHGAGVDVDVVAVATRSRGTLLTDKTLDLAKVLSCMEADGTIADYGPEAVDLTPTDIIDRSDADILVELTTLNIESGQPAVDHISRALNRGIHVITANKGPIAFAYDTLEQQARANDVQLRFEGTVMDGTPIFNLAEKTLMGCEILRLEGVLNSTSNFVLSEMANGRSMKDAIQEAQRKRIVEADPSLDLDGWDAAAKITALANVLMGAKTTPDKVDRKGIGGFEGHATGAAKGAEKIRLMARAEKTETGVKLTVRPETIDSRSPFWTVDGTSGALTISTDLMGDITVIETDPTITQTAYAVFADLLLIADWMRCRGR